MSRTLRPDQVRRVAAAIERRIRDGDLAPGDRLPSERDISTRFDVSRSVVREAIGRLASLGLVRSVHGSGTLVEAPSGRLVTVRYRQLLGRGSICLQDLADVRLPLETAIAAGAAPNRRAPCSHGRCATRAGHAAALARDPCRSRSGVPLRARRCDWQPAVCRPVDADSGIAD